MDQKKVMGRRTAASVVARRFPWAGLRPLIREAFGRPCPPAAPHPTPPKTKFRSAPEKMRLQKSCLEESCSQLH